MEACGVVDACEKQSVPVLFFRGISDFGDEKEDLFHKSRPMLLPLWSLTTSFTAGVGLNVTEYQAKNVERPYMRRSMRKQ